MLTMPNVLYEPRAIRCPRLMTYQGWSIKVYGVCSPKPKAPAIISGHLFSIDGIGDGYDLSYAVPAKNGERDEPNASTMGSGEQLAGEAIDDLRKESHYGLGFVIIHETLKADFVTFCHWHDVNELGIRLWMRRRGNGSGFHGLTAWKTNICTWDLRIIAFERDAWMRHVLVNGTGGLHAHECVILNGAMGPEREKYLQERLNEDA